MLREIVLALFVTGCVHEPSFFEQAQSARDRWERAVCRTPRYALLSHVPSIKSCDGIANNYDGCYDRSTATVQISQALPKRPGLLYQVLTHEMGHSLTPEGGHVPDNAGIMSAYTGSARSTITEADIELICEEYDCPCRNPETP